MSTNVYFVFIYRPEYVHNPLPVVLFQYDECKIIETNNEVSTHFSVHFGPLSLLSHQVSLHYVFLLVVCLSDSWSSESKVKVKVKDLPTETGKWKYYFHNCI